MSRPRASHESGEDSYLASVSDLMVGMLFIFIIMLMAFALNLRSAQEAAKRSEATLSHDRAGVALERDQLAQERDRLLAQQEALQEVTTGLLRQEEGRADLLRTLAATLDQADVPAAVDVSNGVLRLPESLLFDSAQAGLRPEGERALQAVGATLAAALPCYSQASAALQQACPEGATPILEAVLVEGHTDEVPLRGGPFPDNWQLSAARGVNTFKALTRFSPVLETLRNVRGEALLGVSGYEARRPVAAGSDETSRRLNRRIDLRFIVAAPGDTELERIDAQLQAPGAVAVPRP